MVYKFNATTNNAHLEISQEENKAKISVFDEDDIFALEISKETLYDFIGALHSIQSRIKKDYEFDNLSNKF